MTDFSQEAVDLLTEAGWTENRRADVRPYVKALEKRAFEVTDAARAFLESFGGIYIYDDPKERYLSKAVGSAMRRSHKAERWFGRWAGKLWRWFWPVEYLPHEAMLSFDPTLDTLYVHHVRADYAPRLPMKLCYVGLYGKANQVLMVDEVGAVYMGFKEQLWKVADDARDAIDRLLRKDLDLIVEVPPVEPDAGEAAAEVNAAEAIAAAWDALADGYDAQVRDLPKRSAAVEIELAAFERALPQGEKLELLDAGCGVGVHGCRLLAAGHDVTFVDISPRMLDRARSAAERIDGGKPWFDECDLRDMDRVRTGVYDGVISGGTVVSDCGDPEAGVCEIARVLKPGGVAGISLRNLDGPDAPDGGDTVRRQHDAFDAWFFSVDSVRAFFGRAGLVVEQSVPVFMSKPPDDGGNLDAYVQLHLEATDPDAWRETAWEFFVIARKPERDDDEPEVEQRVMRH